MNLIEDSDGYTIANNKIVAISPIRRSPLAMANMWFFSILTSHHEFRVKGTKESVAKERKIIIKNLGEYLDRTH